MRLTIQATGRLYYLDRPAGYAEATLLTLERVWTRTTLHNLGNARR